MPAPPARIGEDDLVRLSQLYARHADRDERARRALRDAHLVGDRRRPLAAPPAASTRLVHGAGGPARRARARAHGRRDGRRRGGGGRARPARRRRCDRGDRCGSHHHARRARDRRERARCARPCSRAAPTPAGSRPAATPAAWRRRSSSGASPRERHWARRHERHSAPSLRRERALHGRARGGAPARGPRHARARARGRRRCSSGVDLPRERVDHEAFLAELEVRSDPCDVGARRDRAAPRGQAGRHRGGRDADGRRAPPGRRAVRRGARAVGALRARGGADAGAHQAHARVRAPRARRACPTRTPRWPR